MDYTILEICYEIGAKKQQIAEKSAANVCEIHRARHMDSPRRFALGNAKCKRRTCGRREECRSGIPGTSSYPGRACFSKRFINVFTGNTTK